MTLLVDTPIAAATRFPRNRPVSYGEFTIDDLKSDFGLALDESRDLFGDVPAVAISERLRETLAEGVPLALSISTEKARSELIIVPVLLEARRTARVPTSLFSGIEFNVSSEKGLRGVCDFLLGRSPEQLTIEAPVVAIVEAKNENMKAGIAQCLAELVAAQLFNRDRGVEWPSLHGAVTTGNVWKFLRLSGTAAQIDAAEYYINEAGKIVAILARMLQ